MPLRRRQFLKNSINTVAAGLVFPTLIPADALGLGKRPAPSNRITLGLIGAGWGLGTAGKFLRFSETQLTGVCDVDAIRAKNAAVAIQRYRPDSQITIFSDFREMLAKKSLDAVIIATPDHWHGPMCIAAARAGVDIYAEAPLSRNPVEGRAIVKTVHLHGRIFQCGLTHRSSHEWDHAVKIAKNGVLGNITHIEIGALPTPAYPTRKPAPDALRIPKHLNYDAWVGPARWHDYDPRFIPHYWRWVSAFGGGELASSTFHYVDSALRGIAMEHSGPSIISGTAQFATFPPYDVELTYNSQLTFQNGIQMQISTEFPRGVKYIGDRGWLHVSDASTNTPLLHASSPEILQSTENDPPISPVDHWQDFLDSIKHRRNPRAPAEPAHRAATITQLAHTAMLLGRRLHWNPNTETISNDANASALLSPDYRQPWSI
ncbi:MAG: Gfo/Idh/MocA family oxidoreductase [Puniceicoccales bacterium]|jgi:predicted dehydrogenase|nr:Gfo/Idh/MocA family oxidoreductase [Puniceicoccales bacterium]